MRGGLKGTNGTRMVMSCFDMIEKFASFNSEVKHFVPLLNGNILDIIIWV